MSYASFFEYFLLKNSSFLVFYWVQRYENILNKTEM